MYKVLFLFIILITAFDYRIFGLNYWDELFIVLVPLYYMFASRRLIIRKKQLNILGTLIVLIAIGLISNALHPEFQSSSVAILKDIIAAIKFPMLMIFLMQNRNSDRQNKILHDAAQVSRVLIYIMFAVAIIGYFVDIGVYHDEIRLVKCYKFFFSHATFLVSSVVMMISILLVDGVKRNRRELIVAGILIFLAGRTKGYIMIAVLLLIFMVKPAVVSSGFARRSGGLKLKKRYMIVGLMCVGIIGYMLGKSKVVDYIGWGLLAARPALYIVGFQLLKDCFPFGSGFGTFASSISGKYYSNVYSLYHISSVYGLKQGNTNYIADTFFPYVYGQFGIMGAITYILLLLKLIKYQLRRIKSYDKIVGFFYLWIYVFVASSAEAFLTNSSSVQLAVVLAVYIGVDCDKNLENILDDKVKEYSEN